MSDDPYKTIRVRTSVRFPRNEFVVDSHVSNFSYRSAEEMLILIEMALDSTKLQLLDELKKEIKAKADPEEVQMLNEIEKKMAKMRTR